MAVYKNDDATIFYDAVKSVIQNSIKPSQFLIVVDGPIGDSLRNVLNSFLANPDNNIEILELPKNLGLSIALNSGLKKIENEIVFRADSDDINMPNRFETQIKYLIDGYDIVGSNINEFDKNKNFIARREVPLTRHQIKKFLKKRNPFNHMTVGYRLSSIVNAGYYPEGFHLREDYALWAIMISNGAKVINIKDTLVNATTGADMYKRRGGFGYAIGELKFQKFLVSIGVKGKFEACRDFLFRFILFVMPSFIREYIYLNILRKR